MTRAVTRGLSGACALAGGTLMAISGFTSHGFFLFVISYFNENLAPSLPPVIGSVVGVILLILNALITFGGIIVIFGGAAMLAGRTAVGTLLIMFGGGAGFPSLLIAMGYYLIVTGIISIVVHAEYWFGILLAATARRFAKKA